MITQETDYAIRVVLYLSASYRDNKCRIPTRELSLQMGIPHRFLRKLVTRMAAVGLLSNQRGKGGGIALERAPRTISLWDVVAAVGPLGVKLGRCVNGRRRCSRAVQCRVHREWQSIQKILESRLRRATFDRLS